MKIHAFLSVKACLHCFQAKVFNGFLTFRIYFSKIKEIDDCLFLFLIIFVSRFWRWFRPPSSTLCTRWPIQVNSIIRKYRSIFPIPSGKKHGSRASRNDSATWTCLSDHDSIRSNCFNHLGFYIKCHLSADMWIEFTHIVKIPRRPNRINFGQTKRRIGRNKSWINVLIFCINDGIPVFSLNGIGK